MFYLRNLKKFFKQSPLIVMTYVLMAVLTPVIAFNTGSIINIVEQASQEKVQSPFFHALIDKNENYSRVSRKLRSLPGVTNVEVVAPEKMEAEAGKILGSLDFEISSDLLELGYAGIKVVFESNLQEKSMELVREYLLRLVGEERACRRARRDRSGEAPPVGRPGARARRSPFAAGGIRGHRLARRP